MTAANLLIDCWECAGRAPEPWRALALLQPAHGGAELTSLAQLPVGQSDAAFLELRRAILGDHVEALARCPGCGARVEVDFRVSDVLVLPGADQPRRSEADGWVVDFRLPNRLDLVAASSASDAEAARQVLIKRCVMRLTKDAIEAAVTEAPVGLIASMEDRMAAADPQADVNFKLTCADCGVVWEANLEPDSLVSSEVSTSVARLLREIHTLAAAYGWSETAIIDLTPARRQAYLDLVGGE